MNRCKGHFHQDKPSPPNQYWIFDSSGRIYNPTSHLCLGIKGRSGQILIQEQGISIII